MAVFFAQIFLIVWRWRCFLHRFFYFGVDYGVFCTDFFISESITAFSAQIFLFRCRLRRFWCRFYLDVCHYTTKTVISNSFGLCLFREIWASRFAHLRCARVGLSAVRFAHTCALRAWYAASPRRYYPSRFVAYIFALGLIILRHFLFVIASDRYEGCSS
jgi:hypothetical protein